MDEILASSWDRKLSKDLAAEIEACTGDKRETVEEMRRFLAVKGYRELLQCLRTARDGKDSEEALRAIAHEMRKYALQRPALSAAAFRSAAVDCPQWRAAHDELHSFMIDVLGDCGVAGEGAEDALNMLRSLVRGFVLNEMMHCLIGVYSYEDSFDSAIRVFVAGLPALGGPRPGTRL
ncbi:TetR-like C-terminal domain-containing protein [Bradyrhizobium sp.]|uniref:TetR-like C-terminal domain-containing protein n=1 Tax=Bradyrhizobium sp. TaxID=376 RepID=UPI00262DBF24|nr:TetR-like C-terminal domain-containing protein [Bradyrhizobium sp.]